MQISLNWLKQYVDIDLTPDELADRLTMLGLEIESVQRLGGDIRNVVVGQILSIEPHPDADKLVVCRTDVGEGEPLQIVCGAKNMQPGDKVPTAKVGAVLPGGFEIGRRKMRGVESQGMMCSPRELNIADDHEGLMILPPDATIGENITRTLGLDDVVYEIEVTPNRNDWASMLGVARELAAISGKPVRVPDIQVEETGPAAASLSSVHIEDPDLCPRYIGRVLTGVAVGPSPEWLVKRLVAAGQRPINNVVDITNYVLMETGHPLHAFDYDRLAENRIVVRRARPGERIVTIDKEDRALTPEMLVIADAERPVALAGIMGGFDSEVGEATTRVFLESAYFNPIGIRRTARQLGMMTEASQRFQRGADPEMALYAIDRAARLMQEIAGATVAPGHLDEYPQVPRRVELELRYARTNALLGADIEPDLQKAYLTRLGFRVMREREGAATFQVPTWRHDCSQEADLIEEIARLYGYDHIEVRVPTVRPSEAVFAPAEQQIAELRRRLIGFGLTEVMNLTFISEPDVQRSGLSNGYTDMVRLQNPLSEKYTSMRSSLLPGLIRNLGSNLRYGTRDIRLFEIGPIFVPRNGDPLPGEPEHVGIALSGGAAEAHWGTPPRPVDLYDLKGIVERIGELFGANLAFEAGEFGPLQPGHAARILLNGTAIGWLGRLSSAVANASDIEQEAFVAELNLEPLLRLTPPVRQFVPIPAFPPSLRDLAVVVDYDVPAGALRDTARQAGGKYLKQVDIFDVYTGKQVPQGKKSVALSLVFQSAEQTLTEKVTQKSFDNIVQRLKKEYGAELR